MTNTKHMLFLLTACAWMPAALCMQLAWSSTLHTDEVDQIAAQCNADSGIIIKHSPFTGDPDFDTRKMVLLDRVSYTITGQLNRSYGNAADLWNREYIDSLNVNQLKNVKEKSVIFCALRQTDQIPPLVTIGIVLRQRQQWLLIQQVDTDPSKPNIGTSEDDRPFVRLFVDRRK